MEGSKASPDSSWAKAIRQDLGFVSRQSSKRPVYVTRVPGVYPYSVVPGGLKSAEALRQAAANDKAVARHFGQFDYKRAHLVRLAEPRDVYVSYRIRDTVFWTQKRIRLKAGEMLLTDGKITARAKCGNQVSDTAKPEVSNEEPEEDVLDQPVALEPIGPALPIRASLRAPELPAGQPVPPEFYASSFQFPYISFDLPLPPRNCALLGDAGGPGCHKNHHHPTVPEPSTMILLASGLAAIGWRYRKHKGLVGA
jgi:PEP-CTERM motif